ncbi:hypothetical protein [Calderihabitans maritimus]|uniref:Uncharacterized protein n=1 Tax=Calderihabitans maritimus TaxID=1246530 RepID=A0A1Z5HR21_9FIRM|nr:hypothetical protein [Calderihabitans maritimus]GAW91878.1 hypothetical protein KKC1_10390 [Calderihabitans maritimus]
MVSKKELNFNREMVKALRPLLRRVQLNFFLVRLPFILAAGLFAAAEVLFISRLFPWENARWYAGIAFVVLGGLAFGMAFIKRPGVWEAARAGDDLGLKERLTTALVDQSGALWEKQREDALKSLQKIVPRRDLPLQFPVKSWGPALVALVALLLTIILPNPMDELLDRQKRAREEIEEEKKRITHLVEEIRRREPVLTETEKEILAALEQLEERLKRAGEAEESIKALSRTEEELNVLLRKEEEKERSLAEVAEILSRSDLTSSLAEAIREGDGETIRKALEKLAQELKGLASEEMASLADILEEAAGRARADLGRNALAGAAKSLSAGTLTEAVKQLLQAGEQWARFREGNTPQTLAKAISTVQEARRQIAQASSILTVAMSGSSGSPQAAPGAGGNGGESGQGISGNSASSAAGPGAVSESGGAQSGQGNGHGTAGGQGREDSQGGGSAGGAGLGSGNGNAGSNHPLGPGQPGTTPELPTPNLTGNYEMIYDPITRLEVDGHPSVVPAQAGEGASGYRETLNGITVPGLIRPYNEVLTEYREQARRHLDRSYIPPAMEDIVRDYFSSLEP